MNAEMTVEGLIQKAYNRLKASDADGALEAFEEALKVDLDNPEVKYGLLCLNWWLDHLGRVGEFRDPFEKGGFVLSRWKLYYDFLDRFAGTHYDPCQYAIRRFVYSGALGFYQGILADTVNQHDPALLLQVGRCYKGTGNYDEALKYLEQAMRLRREDSEVLSELADVNALLAEERTAKVLFREAFFVDPQKVDLRSMESELVTRLRDRVTGMGYEGSELAEWIPVYGNLFGVFSVRRELKSVELGRLRQSIFSLESEMGSGGSRNPLLKPRLLNRYFWLLDHYENTREDPGLAEETMLKIKIMDPAIYAQYIN
jgi:tetratricopeptide (TPR) repeat protein